MSRIKANALLLITAIIWGIAFVSQKTAMDTLGPFTFVAARFALSALVIFPLAYRETQKRDKAIVLKNLRLVFLLGGVFVVAVTLQQFGMQGTTVTNTGFLSGLYAVFTPIWTWVLFFRRPSAIVWIATFLCVVGLWLLGDASFLSLKVSDTLILGCAGFFALHTVLIGHIVRKMETPLFLAFSQFLICALISLGVALSCESITLTGIKAAMPAILFAGLLSGGVAYTLQIVAQQHTTSSDAAIILSSEALFAALAGNVFMGDKLSFLAWTGCGLIALTILLIELWPTIAEKRGMATSIDA